MRFDPDLISDLTAFRLANEADCASPDGDDSDGARMLIHVRDGVVDLLRVVTDDGTADDMTDPSDLDYDGSVHEIADGAPDCYTSTRWREFVDLAAWQEDPTELGFEGGDMLQGAGICLFLIAHRLAWRLIELATVEPVEYLPRGTRMYAQTTTGDENGIAMSETAVCSECADYLGIVDCTDNDALACQLCDGIIEIGSDGRAVQS